MMDRIRGSSGALRELYSPAALRIDGSAETFIDNGGNIYLLPLVEHDFEATERLIEAGLSDAQIVFDQALEQQFIRYPVESDIISFAAALNALEGSQRTENSDITPLLIKVGELLDGVIDKIGQRPHELTIANLGVNRSNDSVELIAPFTFEAIDTAEENSKIELLLGVCKEVIEQSATVEFMELFGRSIDAAVEELGWKYGTR